MTRMRHGCRERRCCANPLETWAPLGRAVTMLMLATIAATCNAVTHHVAPPGPGSTTSGRGTEQDPYRSINRAAGMLRPGDRLWIAPGVYRESVSVKRSGKPGLPIVIERDPRREGTVLILGSEPYTDLQRADDGSWRGPWRQALIGKYPESWQHMDLGEYGRRSEMVFVGAERLRQVLSEAELGPGRFFVDRTRGELVVTPRDSNEPAAVEIGVRQRGLVLRGHHLEVRGITVSRVANSHDVAAFLVAGNHNVVASSTASDNNMDGFKFSGHFLTATGNLSLRNGRAGISASVHDSSLVRNETNDNGWRFGPYVHAGGIKIVGGGPRGVLVEGHVSKGNFGRGIWFDYGCGRNTIVDSTVLGNTVAGIVIEACDGPTVVFNNVVCCTRAWGEGRRRLSSGTGVTVYDSRETLVYQNTIASNEGVGVLLEGGVRQIKFTGKRIRVEDNAVKNNILYENHAGSFVSRTWNESARIESVRTNRFDHNLHWGASPGEAIAAIRPLGEFSSLAALRERTSNGARSRVADPLFIDDAAGNYGVHTESPAMSGGARLTLPAAVVGFDTPSIASGRVGAVVSSTTRPSLEKR